MRNFMFLGVFTMLLLSDFSLAQKVPCHWTYRESDSVSDEIVKDCLNRDWYSEHRQKNNNEKPVLLVGNIINRSTEQQVEPKAFTNDMDRKFINSGKVKIVAPEDERNQVALEQIRQQTEVEKAVELAKQLGANYMLVGDIFSHDETFKKDTRKRYQVDIRFIDIETVEVVYGGSFRKLICCKSGKRKKQKDCLEDLQSNIPCYWTYRESDDISGEIIKDCLNRDWYSEHLQRNNYEEPVLLVGSIVNHTMEQQIEPKAFTNDMDRRFINSENVKIVAPKNEQQQALLEQVRQQTEVINAVELAKQLGANYMLVGDIFWHREKVGKDARKRYQVDIRFIEIETAEVVYGGSYRKLICCKSGKRQKQEECKEDDDY